MPHQDRGTNLLAVIFAPRIHIYSTLCTHLFPHLPTLLRAHLLHSSTRTDTHDPLATPQANGTVGKAPTLAFFENNTYVTCAGTGKPDICASLLGHDRGECYYSWDIGFDVCTCSCFQGLTPLQDANGTAFPEGVFWATASYGKVQNRVRVCVCACACVCDWL